MLRFLRRGLSNEEIAKTLKKIRKEYNSYIITYMKPSRAKDEFESRYYFAAKYKENLAIFFRNEIEILTDLINLEKEKQAQKEKDLELLQKKRVRQNGMGFADKVLKELEDRIRLYPEINITDKANPEVKKLFGALKQYDERYWNNFCKYIRTATPFGRAVDTLQNELLLLSGTGSKNSPLIDRYVFLLERKDQDLRAITYAEQSCIKQVAFLLNEIVELYRKSVTTAEPPIEVTDGYNYLNQLIFNFRLTDIKKG